MNQARVGCGAAIVQQGKLLLVKRVKPPEAGCWGLPGGKVDFLETVEQAVEREIDEELGIHIQATNLLCVINQIDPQTPEHWLSPVFLVEQFAGAVVNKEPEKHTAVDWFDLHNLPEPLTTATQVAQGYLVQIFK